MNALEEIIRAEIRAGGPMRFDRFMDLALYHPGLGYYAKTEGPTAIGREGDFFTSVSVGPLFGRLLARQFYQMWQRLGNPRPFWIVEQGAHDGRLAADILEWCRSTTPDFFDALRYGIVQASGLESMKPALLADPDFVSRLTWFETIASLSAAHPIGVFFSNELVDAFPVRCIARRSGQWLERLVTVDGEKLGWTERPIDEEKLAHAVRTLALPDVEGYTTEINLRARTWIAEVGRALKRGFVVTIDYGFPEHTYYASHRPQGTVRAYVNHRAVDDVLAEPGERDITTHVDFSALVQEGKSAGLSALGLPDQQHFLMGIAHDELSVADTPRTGIAENLRAWTTLTHPDFLGGRFFALVQSIDATAELDGLRFARSSWGQ